jgi:ribonuclease HI
MSSLFPKQTSSSNDWVQAHCDGGSRGNPGPSGFGAVLVDASGRTLAELSEFLGIRTNNFAEYSGLLAVLDYALQNQIPRLKVVSDSELMVKQIQGKYKVNSPDLKPLWQEARNRIARLDGFEISHALRHKNKEADALANQAMDRGMKRTPKDAAEAPVQSLPLRAIPHPAKSAAPPDPYAANRAPATAGMLRGFTKDGVVHVLGGASLPDGIFVKIIRE